jgi:MFS family permease
LTASRKAFRGPWIIFAAFFTFGIASGFPYYNIAFFFDYFRNDHGWTQQTVTFGAPLAVLLTIWAGPLIIPRFSPRWLIIAGTGLIFVAFQMFARMGDSTVLYYAAWCVWMLGYFLAGPVVHQVILSNWFKKRRGRAMGLAYVGGAALGIAGNQLNPWLVTFLPYTEALKISSYVLLLAWPFAFFILRDRPEDIGQTVDGDPPEVAAAAAPLPPPQSYGTLARDSSFWLLLVGSAASIGAIASVNFLMKFVFEEQGFTDQLARNAMWKTASTYALYSTILARLTVGHLADIWPRKTIMVVIYFQVALAVPMLFLITPETPHWVYLFAIVFGFAQGADYMLIPLMASDLFGVRSLSRAMSSIVPSDTVAQYWLPNLISQLRAVWGGYGSALWVVCGVAVLGAIAVVGLRRDPIASEAATPRRPDG